MTPASDPRTLAPCPARSGAGGAPEPPASEPRPRSRRPGARAASCGPAGSARCASCSTPGVEMFADQGLPRRPRRRHREASPRPRTAPSTCTSPTRKSCSARSPRRSPTRCTTLAESLPPARARPDGDAALREWIGRFADLYERYGAGHPGVDRGRDRRQRVRPARHRRAGASSPASLVGRHPARRRRPTSTRTIAALALVAMIERLNYYVLSRQVRGRSRRRCSTRSPR